MKSEAESRYAWLRLWTTLALMTLGGAGMYAVTVALPAVQAEFGVGRSEASLPYTATMIGFGLGGIVIEPTDDLLRLQQELIDAVQPFTEKTGTAAAYVTTPEDPEINQPTIDYVAGFVPDETGKKFNPHVTIGVAGQDYLKTMVAEPFDAFTFSPAAASVYQLGNFGTARKKLKAWDLKP